jgi:DNA invertase Pin-like site-specific DNA recombinase
VIHTKFDASKIRQFMNNFLAAIKAQQAWHAKPKIHKPKQGALLPPEKREPVKDSTIMQILTLQELQIPAKHIAKEASVPVQTVYNVRQRYILIDVKNGTKWYKSVGL